MRFFCDFILQVYVFLLHLYRNQFFDAMSYKSVQEVVTLLKSNDFKMIRQSGSHMVFSNGKRVAVVPNHRSGIEKGTYYSILRQAGLK